MSEETARNSALQRKIGLARSIISYERFWSVIAPVLSVIAAFLAFAWFGGFSALPPIGRVLGIVVFALLLGASFWNMRRFAPAESKSAIERLDRDSGLLHRPALTQSDKLSLGQKDPASEALWALHRKRSEAALARLNVGGPRPDIARRDPWALRVAALIAAFAAFFAAGHEWRPRLVAAFDWTTPAPPPVPPRMDVWVNPPGYTGRPPIFLARSEKPRAVAQANTAEPEPAKPVLQPEASSPVGSIIIIRVVPASDITVDVSGALTLVEPEKKAAAADAATGDAKPAAAVVEKPVSPNAPFERRFKLDGDGSFVVKQGGTELGSFKLTAIPDKPPVIEFVEARRQERGDGLILRYRVNDDYGLAKAAGVLAPIPDKAGKTPRTLVPAPPVALAAPASSRANAADLESTITLPDHPWAGQLLNLALEAVDDAGQTATSSSRKITIPQRVFTVPLAKALVEQRRLLVFDPDNRQPVQIALDALRTGPEDFAISAAEYLALRMVSTRLKSASTDAQLIDVTEQLWQMALSVENQLSAAERRLRQAEQAMKEALERGASPEEMKRLTEELRQAMNEYMREFAERAQRDPNRQAEQQRDPNSKTLSERDLSDMLKEIERLSREGKTEEAQRLLEQLQEAMRNLRMAEGQQGENGQQQGMRGQMNELDKLLRDQQQLRDRTHRDAQRQRRQRERGEQGENGQQGEQGQQGQQGQQGEGQQEQGQQGQGQEGQQGEGGEGNGQSGTNGLGQRQQQLRDRLGQLQDRMRENGMQGEQGLSDAEQAMREAEEALGRGDSGSGVDAQGRALEALRRGAQGLAQQMQERGQEGDGTEQAEGDDQPGRPGDPNARDGTRDDPLGRPTQSRDFSDGKAKVPDETAAERATRVLEELRKRLGDIERPRLELDYFERLLPRN